MPRNLIDMQNIFELLFVFLQHDSHDATSDLAKNAMRLNRPRASKAFEPAPNLPRPSPSVKDSKPLVGSYAWAAPGVEERVLGPGFFRARLKVCFWKALL